jgi:phosphopantetheinyl transferase (holo-ACP synthase)
LRIGNDVVDLSDPETLAQALHRRFDERVFTADEAAAIQSSAQAHRLRWAYWAAKESAYKVAIKLDPTTVFSPTRFKVTLNRNGSGVVVHENNRFSVRTNHSQRYVHAIALSIPSGLYASGFYLPPTERCDPRMRRFANVERREIFIYGHSRANRTIKNHPDKLSLFARQQAMRAIGSLLGIRPDRIEIARGRGIPHARSRGWELPIDISLSHHGCYVAYAICYLMPTSSTSKTSIP